MADRIRIREAPGTECEIHDWPIEGLAKRLIRVMRESFPTGVNVCRECVLRAHGEARANLN